MKVSAFVDVAEKSLKIKFKCPQGVRTKRAN